MTNDRPSDSADHAGWILCTVLTGAGGLFIGATVTPGRALIAGVTVVALILAGITNVVRAVVRADDDEDPYADPPDTQMPSRLAITVSFFVFGAGLVTTAYLPDLDPPLRLAYLICVVAASIGAGVLAYRVAKGRA